MSTSFEYDYNIPTKKEYLCRHIVRTQMIAEGWHPKALKFDHVCNRRAKRMMKP